MGMNGHANCILAVCCPPGSARQVRTLAGVLVHDGVCEAAYAPKVAQWIVDTFDLAPKGTLQDFKGMIAALAREQSAE